MDIQAVLAAADMAGEFERMSSPNSSPFQRHSTTDTTSHIDMLHKFHGIALRRDDSLLRSHHRATLGFA